mmetsp:Transcript_30817/g.46748  ORF Transcript_30817/g.46748 Transcript_30817/m.46748 type:complete len:202 (-) Transcript_30817:204-809(-)
MLLMPFQSKHLQETRGKDRHPYLVGQRMKIIVNLIAENGSLMQSSPFSYRAYCYHRRLSPTVARHHHLPFTQKWKCRSMQKSQEPLKSKCSQSGHHWQRIDSANSWKLVSLMTPNSFVSYQTMWHNLVLHRIHKLIKSGFCVRRIVAPCQMNYDCIATKQEPCHSHRRVKIVDRHKSSSTWRIIPVCRTSWINKDLSPLLG